MSNIKQIKIGNTPYDLKDETARLGKLDNSNVSTVQTTLTASKAFAINDPFMYEGQLYKADSAIAQGGTIVINGTGQNASPTTIEALINLHSGGGSGGHTILNSDGSAMNQRSKLQFNGATVTDDSTNDKTIVTTTPQSMIGDAWVTSHAYAIGDYCIDGNVLYKCKTAHTSSASYRPPYASYWDVTTVANEIEYSGGEWIDITSSVTLNNSISWNNANTWFRKCGKLVIFSMRGTFPSSATGGTLATGISPVANTYYPIMSTDWVSPSIIATCSVQSVAKIIGINGNPSLGGKGFVISGYYIEL